MKTILSLVAVGFTIVAFSPAFAEDPPPTTKAECQKTPGMEWDESQNKCVEETPGG